MDYQSFLSSFFCFTRPKSFVVDSFCVSGKLCYRKSLWIGGGTEGLSRFSFGVFLSHSTKKFRWGIL